MVCIQSYTPSISSTFDDFVNNYVEKLADGIRFVADTVIDVFDRYDNPNCTKSAERERREASKPKSTKRQVIGGRSLHPWSDYLNLAINKHDLTIYLADKICESESNKLALTKKRNYCWRV